MRKNHSTISRRDFMKALGLGAATLGAAGAATTVFHDVDEITASTKSIQKLPWYVKERDYKNPTVPIDWTVLPRLDGSFPYQSRPTLTPQERYDMGIPGGSSGTWASPEQAQVLFDYCKEEFPGWDPGYLGLGDNRTTALFVATKFMRMANWPAEIQQGINRVNIAQAISAAGGSGSFQSWVGLRSSETLRPQDFNYPRWQGTPEENLRTMRAVVRFLGGSDVGVTELDNETLKFMHTKRGTKDIVIEDVDDGYETATKVVIPRKCKYVLQWNARQPFESTRRQAGEYEDAAVYSCYQRHPFAMAIIHEFIYALGYTCVSPYMSGYHTVPFAMMTGLGEHCRMGQPVLTPKYGVVHRAMWIFFTDLPMALTKPINFGGYKFCENCGICANSCPFDLMQKDKPSWEAIPGTNGRYGFLGYRTDSRTCPHCPVCHGKCPFNSNGDGSFVHDLVRNTSSLTSLFNGFFSNME
ncbi:MAG: reductive dehalogenase, partial [Chloroflexi bacterium]|nr:reductive dehalogenase [Chloroflexota bacterium]